MYIFFLKLYGEDSSHSTDSYSRYTQNPANKHDDSKLQEKYKNLPPTGAPPPKNDPYRFTRSTLQKQQSTPNIGRHSNSPYRCVKLHSCETINPNH